MKVELEIEVDPYGYGDAYWQDKDTLLRFSKRVEELIKEDMDKNVKILSARIYAIELDDERYKNHYQMSYDATMAIHGNFQSALKAGWIQCENSTGFYKINPDYAVMGKKEGLK